MVAQQTAVKCHIYSLQKQNKKEQKKKDICGKVALDAHSFEKKTNSNKTKKNKTAIAKIFMTMDLLNWD